MGQVVVQVAIQRQSDDARIINQAGAQRMLSQRLVLMALAQRETADPTLAQARAAEAQRVRAAWRSSQDEVTA